MVEKKLENRKQKSTNTIYHRQKVLSLEITDNKTVTSKSERTFIFY